LGGGGVWVGRQRDDSISMGKQWGKQY
jgi:hypothetical protein